MVVRFRVRVLLDRKEVLVSSAAKTLPFWTRTEPVEPGSILRALPPLLQPLFYFSPPSSRLSLLPPPPAPLSQALWVQCHVAD